MSGYLLLPAAARDLESIWDYTECNWGVQQAEAYIRQIQHVIENAAQHPDFGKQRADIDPKYYSVAAGSHVVFFRVEPEGIVVVRILHQRMDPCAHRLSWFVEVTPGLCCATRSWLLRRSSCYD